MYVYMRSIERKFYIEAYIIHNVLRIHHLFFHSVIVIITEGQPCKLSYYSKWKYLWIAGFLPSALVPG